MLTFHFLNCTEKCDESKIGFKSVLVVDYYFIKIITIPATYVFRVIIKQQFYLFFDLNVSTEYKIIFAQTDGAFIEMVYIAVRYYITTLN